MNKWEKEALEAYEGGEAEVLKKIEKQYKRALADIDRNIMILQSDELTQSRIYRIEHQKALRQQVSAILDKLHSDEYATISQFLSGCYTDGFVGAMYNLHGQGIPLLLPIDPKRAVRAVLTDSKLSKPLYEALGVDFGKLKRQISAEISRGISSGMSYNEIARNISWTTNAPMSRARTIVRTEAHRITQASHYDAATQVKKKGVDIVLQWDASLDGDTRDTHRMLDGTIIEVGEYFESGGNKARYPGDFGDPAEDCNCRCVLTERARSALDEDELKTLQERAEFFGLDKTKVFKEFQEKYLHASNNQYMRQDGNVAMPPEEYDGVFDDFAELQLSKEEATALSKLHTLSEKSGYEYCAIVENGVAGKPYTSNLPNAVKMDLDNYGNGLTILHSHTNATPFSVADFEKLIDDKVDKIGVIGYNNDIFMAYIGSGETPSIEEFNDIVKEIRRAADNAIFDDPNFLSWSIEERNYMAIREQAYRIARHFGWTLEGGRIDG